MDVKPLSDQERSDFDEAWAKFACLMRGMGSKEGSAVDIGEAAVRFLRVTQELGLERVIYGHALTGEHLATLGPRGVAMAGVGLASKSAAILAKIIQMEQAQEQSSDMAEAFACLAKLLKT